MTIEVVTVYGLVSSAEPHVIRYVGQTTSPVGVRLGTHIRKAPLTPAKPLSAWITKTHESGDHVLVIPLQTAAAKDVDEAVWIQRFLPTGLLLNRATSGTGGWKASVETKRKVSEASKKLWADPTYRNKVKSRQRETWTPERRSVQAARLLGTKQSVESRAKRSDTMKQLWAQKRGTLQ